MRNKDNQYLRLYYIILIIVIIVICVVVVIFFNILKINCFYFIDRYVDFIELKKDMIKNKDWCIKIKYCKNKDILVIVIYGGGIELGMIEIV